MNALMRVAAAATSALVFGLAPATAASADVIIKMKETADLDQKQPKVSTGAMMIGTDQLAIRWDDGAEPGRGGFIFRADKGLIWVVDDRKKSFQQIDQAFVDQVAAQVAAASALVQARLAQMPPDQRAKAEEMMKRFAGGMQDVGGALQLDYRRTGETRVIDGHACTKVDTYRGEDLISHSWVAPYADLNLSEKDATVFEKMSDFVAKMSGPMANTRKKDYIPMHELGGVPLLTQEVEHGKVTRESVVESVTRGSSPTGSFEVPPGYKLQPMPPMERGK